MDGLRRMSGLRRWTDDDGVEWVRRGGALDPKRARHLLLDPATRVLRLGQPDAVAVAPDERADYWSQIAPYVTGKAGRQVGQKTDDHFDCELTEFRDAQGRVTVTVHESC